MASNDGRQALGLIGSILPTIMAGRRQDAIAARQKAAADAQARIDKSTANLAGDLNQISMNALKDQELVKTARNDFDRIATGLQDAATAEGSSLTAEQLSQQEGFINGLKKFKTAISQASLRDKPAIELAARQRVQDALTKGEIPSQDIMALAGSFLTGLKTSETQGATDQANIIDMKTMQKTFGVNFTEKDVATKFVMTREANKLGVRVDEMTTATLHRDSTFTDLLNLSNLDTRHQIISKVGGLTNGVELSSTALKEVRQTLDTKSIDLHSALDAVVQKSIKDGGGLPDKALLKQAHDRIDKEVAEEWDFYNSHSKLSILKDYNELSEQLIKNGAGAQVGKIRKVLESYGQAGKNVLLGFMQKEGKMKEGFANQLSKMLPGVDVGNVDAIFTQYLSSLNDAPNPKTVEVTGPMAVEVISQPGDVSEGAKQHAVKGIAMLAKTPKDVQSAIKKYSNDDFARNIVNGDNQTKADFVGIQNSHMKMLLNKSSANGESWEYVAGMDRMEVAQVGRRVKPAFRAMPEHLLKPEHFETKKIINTQLTQTLNSYHKEMIKSGRYTGVLKDNDDWIRDVIQAGEDMGVEVRHPAFNPIGKGTVLDFTPFPVQGGEEKPGQQSDEMMDRFNKLEEMVMSRFSTSE